MKRINKMMAVVTMLVLMAAQFVPSVTGAQMVFESQVVMPTIHFVVFVDADGEVLSELIVQDQGNIRSHAPKAPELEGYEFIEWDSNSASLLQMIVEDTVFTPLYAPSGEGESVNVVEPEADKPEVGEPEADEPEENEPEAGKPEEGEPEEDEPEEGEPEDEVLEEENQFVMIERFINPIMRVGDTFTLKATPVGLDDVEYAVQWQCNAGDGWVDIPGGNDLTLTVVADGKNINYDWRILVTPLRPQE